jgi:hypothetical protein
MEAVVGDGFIGDFEMVERVFQAVYSHSLSLSKTGEAKFLER